MTNTQNTKRQWTRIEDGYESGAFQIFDNGRGFGPVKGSGRWALMRDGKWIANLDTLADAKQCAKELDLTRR